MLIITNIRDCYSQKVIPICGLQLVLLLKTKFRRVMSSPAHPSECFCYSILTELFEVLPKALSFSLMDYMLCTANAQHCCTLVSSLMWSVVISFSKIGLSFSYIIDLNT